MSGGYFDHQQYRIRDVADSIQKIIDENEIEDEYGCKTGYSEHTIYEMMYGIEILRIAEIYAQRIDWLRSGDDSEESFHKRLKQDLEKIQ